VIVYAHAVFGTRVLTTVAVAVVSVALSVSATAAPTAQQGCLDLTRAHGLNTTAIMQGLDITADQKRALKANLASYNSVRGWPGLDGLDLTTEQKVLVQKRINEQVAAWNAHPLGWPCAAFAHRARTVAWVKAKLIANAFAPASLRVTSLTTRQIQLRGTQNGIDAWIIVARNGARDVLVELSSTHSGGGTYRYTLPFVP